MLLLALFFLVRAERTWPVRDVPTLLQVLAQATAGDVVELEPGEYIFTTPPAALAPILIDKPLTLRSRDRRQPAVLKGDGSSLLIAVTSSLVTISDLVVGAQRSGAGERSIDILYGAGTQTVPANAETYNAAKAGNEKRSLLFTIAMNQIISARGAHKAPKAKVHFSKRSLDAASAGVQRVLHDLRLDNVDFSASRAGTNVAFAQGSYASVFVGNCVFGRAGAPYINALVSVGDALFEGLAVHGNTMRAEAHVLIGSPTVEAAALGLNYWAEQTVPQVYIGGSKLVPETYCLDAQCEQRAPIIDVDAPTVAYPSLAAALAANVQRIRITDDIVLTEPAVVKRPYTTIEGAASCNGAPLVTVRDGGAIVSINAALVGVRNLRMHLTGANTVGFVYTDGSAQRLSVAKFAQSFLGQGVPTTDDDTKNSAVSEFDGFSVLGDGSADQLAMLISAPKVRIEVEDAIFVRVAYAIVVHRGALVSMDSSYFAPRFSAIYAETVTHQAALRVSGSTFIGCENAAIELGAGASSNNLREFYVSCCQFLFNKRRSPLIAHDCAKKPTLCAAALRYNTIITDFAPDTSNAAVAEQHMLELGANHVEHGRRRDDYLYFGEPTKQFSLSDTQGRLSWVSGALDSTALRAAFLLATYAPMRTECFEVDGISPDASVVSDVLEVRSDSMLHSCASVAARFRIDNAASLPASLAVFGVSQLGSHSTWTQAVSVMHPAGNQATIESTIVVHNVADDRHTHRLVVVALDTLPDKLAAALHTGAATTVDVPRPIAKRLCAVCSGTLPARLLDEFCGGSTDNVRTSFDAAYTELSFGASTGAPRMKAVSIYVFGTCRTSLCPIMLDHNENIEGTSAAQRGTLVQGRDCGGEALIRFNGRSSSHSSIRYIVAQSEAEYTVRIDAPAVASGSSGAPIVAYSTISTGIISDSRNGGRFLGNDFGTPNSVHTLRVTNKANTKQDDPLIIEANRFLAFAIAVESTGEVRIDRNTFAGAGGEISGDTASLGKMMLTANENLRRIDTKLNEVSVLGNTLATGAAIVLRKQQSYVGSGAALTAVTVALSDTARLTAAKFDSASRVMIDSNANVVLRDVRFDNIAASLLTEHRFPLCAKFELTSTGIDTARSLIYATDGVATLTADQQKQIVNDPTLYWALDGSLTRCADGLAPQRTAEYCGCTTHTEAPATQAAAPTKKPNKVVKSRSQLDVAQNEAVVLQTDGESSSNTTLIIILIVFGVVVLICLIIACLVAVNRRNADRTEVLTSRANAQYAYGNNMPPVTLMSEAPALAALNIRQRHTAGKVTHE